MVQKFKAVSDYGDYGTSENLEANLIVFLNWGFLNIGAFNNVMIPTSGYYGGDSSYLSRVSDPYYRSGQVWQGHRKDWIYEGNFESLDYPYQPINISGIYVNGTFYANGSNVPMGSGFKIDYPNGRVIFDNPLTGTVRAEYSYRFVQVTSSDSQWWNAIQFNSLRVDDPQFTQLGSGAWDIMSKNRVQLPCVVVSPVARVRRYPLELGSPNMVHEQDVAFHILTETPSDRKKVFDTLVSQKELRFQGFDMNLLAGASGYPLKSDMTLNTPSGYSYSRMISPAPSGCRWGVIEWSDISSEELSTVRPLYASRVIGTFSMYLP